MTYSLQVLLILCIIVAAAKIAGSLFVRWGQPGVLGEILVGLILGPTLLNMASWGIFSADSSYKAELEKLSQAANTNNLSAQVEKSWLKERGFEIDDNSDDFVNIVDGHEKEYSEVLHRASNNSGLISLIKELAAIGVIFLMFIAGMGTDLREMRRVGIVAFSAAVGGIVLPFIAGAIIGRWVGHFSIYESIFIGAILTATSVSISAQTLIELKALKSKEGTTILGAAVIDDILGIIILSLLIAFKPRGTGVVSHGIALPDLITHGFSGLFNLGETTAAQLKIVILIILMVVFFIIAWILGTKYLDRFANRVRHWPTAEALTAFAIFICLLYSWGAEFIGSVAAITGAYVAGLLFGQTSLKKEIEQKFSIITYSFFVPIFFVSIGLNADARPLFAPFFASMNNSAIAVSSTPGFSFFWLTIIIIVAAVLTKVLGCYIGSLLSGFSNLAALRVGVGMISRGEVGLIIATVGLAAGIIDRNVFTMMVIMVLVTTLATPILLKIVFSKFGNVEMLSDK